MPFQDECGIVGCYGVKDAANLVYLGLYSLQHRGQEGAGIVSYDGSDHYSQRYLGLVSDVFTREKLRELPGKHAIGHVRYSTAGEKNLKNVQPLSVNYSRGGFALAHNGNLVNAQILRAELEAYGSIFQSNSDTEVIIHLIAVSRLATLEDRIVDALGMVRGAYSLVLLTEGKMIACRDPYGIRPLSIGKLRHGWAVASETCAFDLIGAKYIRDVEPGEIVIFDEKGMRSIKPFPPEKPRLCVFEYVYFSRPDSVVFGNSVYEIRKEMGRQLAREWPVPDADMVMAVPDSGVSAALGYAEEAGLPFEMGLVRNHYVGRTFIEPSQQIRMFGVKVKLNPLSQYLKKKKLVVIDDSIVRGTTSRKIVQMLKDAGAKEVHMRISSPPTTHSCFYGVDTPTRKELIASKWSVEEIENYLGATSLGYLSNEGMIRSTGCDQCFCDACFTGDYPISPVYPSTANQMQLFT